jgi:signal transduction histidine kinase
MAEQDRARLAGFLRQRRAMILDEWERRARLLAPARRLDSAALRDHLPQVIEQIAELAEVPSEGVTRPEPAQHALHRLYEGYDLADVVREYSLLREIILDATEDSGIRGSDELRLLSRGLDQATEIAVEHFARASERVLKALDRISTEAVGQQGLDALLNRMLTAILEASPAIDEATILLREGNRLVVRASVGLLENRQPGFSLAVGEGFSGAIAADGKPRLLRDASNAPIIASADLRRAGVRALFGVPLLDGPVIGVAHIGSRTAFEFSDEDKLLFRAMANRATAFLVEERLRERERRGRAELEAILESIPDGVYVGDTSGMKFVNRVGLALMGVDSVEELKRPVDELMERTAQRHPDTGQPLRPDELAFVHALAGETVETEVALTPVHSRAEVIVRSVAAPVCVDGRIIGAVAVNTDITERKHKDEQLRREVEYRERFVSILGHDLRTPVSAISMAATLLISRNGLPEHFSRMVRRILTSTVRIERMIRDLLDFSRARTGGIPIQRARMDLCETTRAVVDELALANPKRVIELRTDGDLGGSWDAARLSQVVSNLIANALTYSPEATPVRVALSGEPDRVVLAVSNQGPPIPESMLPELFEPFRRGTSGTAPSGLGLGLFIVRSIVDAHGGDIAVESAAGNTTFRVFLPRRR